jgi:hypothetical protein
MKMHTLGVFSQSDQQALDVALAALKEGDVIASVRALSRTSDATGLLTYDPDSSLSSERIKIAQCLLTYDYPELQQITESVKWDFALVSAWTSLLSTLPHRGKWADPLVTILGTEYILNVDVEAMAKAIYGEGEYTGQNHSILPVPYEQRAELFPELLSLSTLSLSARTIFARAMRYVSQSSLAECRRIGPLSTPEAKHGLIELTEAGLIDPEPGQADLLMNFTLKVLKQFAFEYGVKPRGPKHRLVEAIVAQVSPEEIKSLLGPLSTDKFVRLLILNLPLLKKHIWSETDRVDFYLHWIKDVHCLGISPPAHQVVQQLPADFDLKPWMRTVENPEAYLHSSSDQTEVKLVRRIWDSKCDEILVELADKYAWDASFYVSDAIAAYLPSDQLEAFKKACEEHETHVWNNVLMYYGRARLAELGIKIREPRLLKCAGCGKQFLESSIHMNLAKRVGYKIHFCYDCYDRALSGFGLGEISMSQDDMLSRLAELATVLEGVPLATFVRRPDFTMISEEKQITIVKALLAMPSYETYVKTFGLWLKALILAGILEDGTQPVQLGTRCIAADGHECLSLAEKTIDDWLSARDIPHEKEPLYPYHAYLNPSGRMRADWQVGKVFIEYAGLMDEPDYAAKMETKQELAAEFGLVLIVINPKEVLNLDRKLGRLLDS